MTWKCLSLWQPWATLWVGGLKRWETRGWRMQYRGPLLVHASKTQQCLSLCKRHPFAMALRQLGYSSIGDLPLGAIIGQVTIVACKGVEDVKPEGDEEEFGDYTPGRFAIVAEDPVRFRRPIPFKGAQGIFDVPDEAVAEAIRRQPEPATGGLFG